MYADKQLQDKYSKLLPFLDEKTKRLVLAADAASMGRGGISKVSSLSGVSRVTLHMGIKELQAVAKAGSSNAGRIRKAGGGRKKETDKHSGLVGVIEELVSPHIAGDPMKPLLWTSKSLRNIAQAVQQRGYQVSHKLVGIILKKAGYSLQRNRKTDEGGSHADRDAQFNFINDIANEFLAVGAPVISVDCKKKELIGNFKNEGAEWSLQSNPTQVKVYDFIDTKAGKAIPYGVYDIANNEGWVSVGISHDTACFAVATIRSWWNEIGKNRFEQSNKLLITADSGGSNSARSRLWKKELQLLADETGMEITVSHLPPGTSKWNKIEHRLFSHISMNWRARPLTSLQMIVDLIGAAKTAKGLKVRAQIDTNEYQTGKKITDEELQSINIIKSDFHGEWNYTIKPIS
jgi:hypothetical protein